MFPKLPAIFKVPQIIKLEAFSSPKLIGSVSLAWTLVLFIYLFHSSLPVVSHPSTSINALTSLISPAEPDFHSTLITYVYSESGEALENLLFFLDHGLHAKADFIFIFNGETNDTRKIPKKPNIKIVQRNNTCYDLGAHAEVLTKDDLWLRYKKFIIMNASVRGPFIPHWAEACWSDKLLNKITNDVKLVGITINCWPTPHVQSMLWATDRTGMSLLLQPPKSSPRHDGWMEVLFAHPAQFPRPEGYIRGDSEWVEPGLNKCFQNRQQAVEAEIAATGIIFGAHKKVDVMLMKFQTDPDYNAHCSRLGAWDPQSNGGYDGANYHMFETMFIKTNRGIDARLLALQTGWMDRSQFSSYDYC
ncbi:uncharacterized protein PAC_05751 [Phialocephala subalpina]|uniref:Uncharacterized protein n=1 Tax=Phialocephala subalpina TaxID=576137 RepID=A0A1L7WSY0_9HELO|nr:uncharacterized protein PAC_05751 [Phialocephala subalpina]